MAGTRGLHAVAGRHDEVGGAPDAPVGAHRVLAPSQDTASTVVCSSTGAAKRPWVALEDVDVLRGVEEAVGVVAVVGETGQADHPVGGEQPQGVPALAAPALAEAPPLEHDVVAPRR